MDWHEYFIFISRGFSYDEKSQKSRKCKFKINLVHFIVNFMQYIENFV
jgi:hypothetical protein